MPSEIITEQHSALRRSQLQSFAEAVLESMVAGSPDDVPVVPLYIATENGKPTTLQMMSAWRTITAIPGPRRFVIDPEANQIFFFGPVEEDSGRALLVMRLSEADGRLTEFESHISRSRADSGWHFELDGLAGLPPVWWQAATDSDRPSRAELTGAARAAAEFDIQAPPPAADLQIIDTGFVVKDGTPWPLTVMPVDPDVRTPVIDLELGIGLSVVWGEGYVAPLGAVLPDSATLQIREGMAVGSMPPIMRPARTTVAYFQLTKLLGGEVRGVLGLPFVMPLGARSIWA